MRTAQQIAREALSENESTGAWGEREHRFAVALSEIAAIPEPVPFALPVNELRSIPVARVDSAENCGISVRLWVGDMDYHVSPPYAAAWLRLFVLPEKEASK